MIIVSAVAGEDYTPVLTMLTFQTGATGRNPLCVDINISDDDVLEGDEAFIIELTPVTPGVLVGNAETIVIIMPDDDS